MFARRRRRYDFVVKSFTTGSDFRSSSPTVRFCIEVPYHGERCSLVVADDPFCIRAFYYGERVSLVVADGTLLY